MLIRGPGGEKKSLSDTCKDPATYERLTDAYVSFKIEDSGQDDEVHVDLRRAREILARIMRRDFYHILDKVNISQGQNEVLAGMIDNEVV